MKRISKNRMLATLLLSAFTIGIENTPSEAFSRKFVFNITLKLKQLEQIKNLENNSSAYKKFIKIGKNLKRVYKQIILLTLAGIRKENNDKWKTILKALYKSGKKLEIRFSDNFKKSCQIACSTSTSSGNPVIMFNTRYFVSERIDELQNAMCHEIGHIYMESILINKEKQKSWLFEDRYISDFIEPSEQPDELIKFSNEYRIYKQKFKRGEINRYRDIIYTKSGYPLTIYGLKSKDDSEMIADSMAYHLMNNKNVFIISIIASYAAKQAFSKHVA